MMNILQWGGTVGVVVAYWFYMRRPLLAAYITIAGCVSILLWALLLEPAAWGVVALESAVIAINLRNLWIAAP